MTGPLIVEDPDEPHADTPDATVFLQDWFHDSSDTNFEFWAQNTRECVIGHDLLVPLNDTCFRLLISQDLFIHIQLPTV